MISLPVDQTIAELLDDPLISLMIQADRVNRQALANELRRLHRQINGVSNQAEAMALPTAFGRAPTRDLVPLAQVTAAATRSNAGEGCVQ
jgi:DICT domain-containing protein